MLEYRFRCPLAHGVHARPAKAFEQAVGRWCSEVALVNERTGRRANGRSVLSLVGADVRFEDACVLVVEGPDEVAAMAGLRGWLEEEFAGCDEPLGEVECGSGEGIVPASLRLAGVRCWCGEGVAPGLGRGVAVMLGGVSLPAGLAGERAGDAGAERERLAGALAGVESRLERRLMKAAGRVERGIAEAHLAILRDVELRECMLEGVGGGLTAGQAAVEASGRFAGMLRGAGNPVLAERGQDVEEICGELLVEIYGEEVRGDRVELREPSVCVGEALGPGALLGLDRGMLKGLVLHQAGATSHTVILARSLGIPVVAGAEGVRLGVSAGDRLIVDANAGVVAADGSRAAERYYEQEVRRIERRRGRLAAYRGREAATADGARVVLAGNVGRAEEVGAAVEQGAEGIGLLRTEMVFTERSEAPSEEEQYEVYRRVVEAAGGRPVVIRTFDIGGDKPVGYLELGEEANPFLGYRGVRIYREHQELLDGQLRAVLRASAIGPVKVLIPMVSGVEEMRWVRGRVEAAKGELAGRGAGFDAAVEVGIMVEVPSVAYAMGELAGEADFFSIGTNDLAQYFFAADRQNSRVEGLCDVWQPSFLRLLRHIVREAHGAGRQVGMCGEMAGMAGVLPVLVGLGLDSLSMAGGRLMESKAELARFSRGECEAALEEWLGCGDAGEVRARVVRFRQEQLGLGLLEGELIVVDSAAGSKAEVLKEAADNLFVAGRTERPLRVEEALWRREEVYETGVGMGFAIPHCKCDDVLVNSVGLIKLREPVAWNGEEERVGVVFVLTLRESEAGDLHMKILARLARRIMHEDFRARVMELDDAGALEGFVAGELGLVGGDKQENSGACQTRLTTEVQ